MADGGGFHSSHFNNPNVMNRKGNWTNYNATRSREGSSSSDGNRGKTQLIRHPLNNSTVDGVRGYSYCQTRQTNNANGGANRSLNSSCTMSQGYSMNLNPAFSSANKTLTPSSRGHQGQTHFDSLQMHSTPPCRGMVRPGNFNYVQSNSFLTPPPPPQFVPNQMYTNNTQCKDVSIPFLPPMYNMHNAMGMQPAPPPPTSLPPSLPQNDPISLGSQPGLMLIQGGIVQPHDQEYHTREQGTVSKSVDQEWIDKFVEERKYTKCALDEKGKKPKLKVGESRHILQRWMHLLDELASQRDKLIDLIKCGESEWQRELQKLNIIKEKLHDTQKEFSAQVDISNLNAVLQKKRKKRQWQNKRNKVLVQEKLDLEKKRFELHLKIDEWREKEIAKDQAKFKAASMKKEAGGVLGDIRRKQNDSSKSLNLLQALTKLRNFRKQEAELKGVYQKPTAEQNKLFNEQIMFLEKLMKKHHELYDSEEKTLVVMLAEEEEEKERERRERKQRKQLAQAASSESCDPMRDFYRYYTQGENGLDSLIHIRHGWDMCIVPDSMPGASHIPQGTIMAVAPCSDTWAKTLKDNG